VRISTQISGGGGSARGALVAEAQNKWRRRKRAQCLVGRSTQKAAGEEARLVFCLQKHKIMCGGGGSARSVLLVEAQNYVWRRRKRA
jgi:hypothetical protein